MLIDNNQERPDFHSLGVEETAARLRTDLKAGLSDDEAGVRLGKDGPNTLQSEKKESFLEEFFEELREPMVLMLLVTGVLYAVWGEIAEAVTIFIIILTLNLVEVVNEQRSKKAIAGLRKLAQPEAGVWRGGRYRVIPATQVVPGDRIQLQDGHRVPADARLVESFGLSVDESALTGESLPAEKDAQSVCAVDAPLAERRDMVYSSTLVTRGKGTALVTATGLQTEIGRIAGLARGIREPRTPLQLLMDELSRTLIWFALGFSVLVPLVGILAAHQPPKQMLLTGLSLAFATIPEEMPIIITMVLSLGAFRLSKKNAIVRRLKAVESLGSVTVIATDKTGTLTANRMAVREIEPQALKKEILENGALCNDAVLDGADFSGDAVDAALLRAAREAGLDLEALKQARPVITEYTFDNLRKRMSLVYRQDGRIFSAVKGAPEAVLPQCEWLAAGGEMLPLTEIERGRILGLVSTLALNGSRVIAIARRQFEKVPLDQVEAESHLVFLGLAGLVDPLRPEAQAAVLTCREAGIRTIMVTGDHPLTAAAIARQAGLNGDGKVVTGPELERMADEELQQVVRRSSIFARATPEHKLRIVRSLQALGERVAVTGDGVNDAPALAAADIGVAMGESGTDVAREAGDMLLADDNFATIVSAVQEGRLIYENLKKGVRYYLACKLALVLITLLPTLLFVPVPFAPVQIILMELFMDLMAAASFVAERAESDLLVQKPRDPKARFMDRAMLSGIVFGALGLFAAVSAVYLSVWFGTQDLALSQTAAFFTWLVGHVFLAFNMRSERQPVLQMGLTGNRLMLAWGGAVAAFLFLISAIPVARELMKVTTLNLAQWGLVLGAALVGTFWIEARKLLTFGKKTGHGK